MTNGAVRQLAYDNFPLLVVVAMQRPGYQLASSPASLVDVQSVTVNGGADIDHAYLLAILAHTTFNSVAIFLAQLAGAAVSELALLVLSLLAGFCALKFRPRFWSVGGQPAADGAALPGEGASGFSHVDANPPTAEQRVVGANLLADGQKKPGVPARQAELGELTGQAGHGSPNADS
jgi:hypothetical protein